MNKQVKKVIAAAMIMTLNINSILTAQAAVPGPGASVGRSASAAHRSHIDGLEDDLLATAYKQVDQYWDLTCAHIDQVNLLRAQYGLTPLTVDYELCVLAAYRSAHMAKYQYESHWDPNGVMYAWDNYAKAINQISGYIIGENYYYADTTNGWTEETFCSRGFEWLKNSPTHLANMLNTHYSIIGTGICYDAANKRHYLVELFRSPMDN